MRSVRRQRVNNPALGHGALATLRHHAGQLVAQLEQACNPPLDRLKLFLGDAAGIFARRFGLLLQG